MNESEARALADMALGRLFRICSRPYQEGDERTYADCRSAFLEAAEVLGVQHRDTRPNYIRDRAWEGH